MIKILNIIFPLWFMYFFPMFWLIAIPANFIIDSIVLIVSMFILKVNEKKKFYIRNIWKVFLFGFASDIIGSVLMFTVLCLFDLGNPDALYLTLPGLLISAGLIFIFNYFISFRKIDKKQRLIFSLIFSIITAPYLFLIPMAWIY